MSAPSNRPPAGVLHRPYDEKPGPAEAEAELRKGRYVPLPIRKR